MRKTNVTLVLKEISPDPIQYKPNSPTLITGSQTLVRIIVSIPESDNGEPLITSPEKGVFDLTPAGLGYLCRELRWGIRKWGSDEALAKRDLHKQTPQK